MGTPDEENAEKSWFNGQNRLPPSSHSVVVKKLWCILLRRDPEWRCFHRTQPLSSLPWQECFQINGRH